MFSIIPITGTIKTNHKKYNAVHTCPTVMNGSSTWQAPKYINIPKLATKTQNANRIKGRNCEPRIREVSSNGIASKISNELNIATTPASLLGIDRKIA